MEGRGLHVDVETPTRIRYTPKLYGTVGIAPKEEHLQVTTKVVQEAPVSHVCCGEVS